MKNSKFKEKLLSVYQDDYESRDRGNFNRISFIDTQKLKDMGVEFYQIREGRNEIDILPYVVKTNKHPKLKSGDYDYKLDIWVHRFVGDGDASVVCLKQTYNKPCPICEEYKKMIASDEYNRNDDEVKRLLPKRRVLYNVVDLLDDKYKGIKIFEINHFEFQKEIIEEAESSGGDEIINFADPEEGRTIVFRGTEREGEFKKASMKPKGFKFVDREPYDENVINKTVPLDDILIVHSYDDVKKILMGTYDNNSESDEEDGDEKLIPRKKNILKDDDSEVDDKFIPRKKNTLRDDDDHDNEESKSRKNILRDKDDDSVDRLVSKKKNLNKNLKENKCPHGGVFHDDCDELDECKNCKLWNECADV